ncbi:MAG TPA: DUF58 domain-containing protein, partial [Burkholderiaceae bacterium]|nr:DUF58 domain-containing protein [Burkholderiaceae bacterium]
IDWNVTARLQTPYVREYHEDREVLAWFLVDLSGSVGFGSGGRSKREVATEFVAVIARLLSRHGNAVGAMCYGDHVDAVIPARTGRRHLLHIIGHLQGRPEAPAAGATELGVLLRAGAETIKRRSIVFVVSDFISAGDWAPALARLSMRHEVVAIRIHDPMESTLPDIGLVVVQDAETGEQMTVDTHDRRFRERFARAATRREEALRDALARGGVDTLELSTSDALADAVLRFADLRKQRSRLSGGGSLAGHLAPGVPR